MESIVDIPLKKPRLKQNLNLHVAEYIQQFELPQQYPSTVTEFYLPKLVETNTTPLPAKNMQNIISALPLSRKMKFIPNQNVIFSENLEKLKLKLSNGKDLGEVKIILPEKNDKFKTTNLTISKYNTKIIKPTTWSIKSQSIRKKNQKANNISKIFKNSLLNDCVKKPQEINSSTVEVQILNNTSSTSNIQNIEQNNKSANNVIKKLINKKLNAVDELNGQSNILTFKKLPKFQNVFIMQKVNQDSNSVSNRFISLKAANCTSENSHIKKSSDEVIFNNTTKRESKISKTRDNSLTEYFENNKNKKLCLNINLTTEVLKSDSKVNDKQNKISNRTKNIEKAINKVHRQNVIAVFLNENTEKLSIASKLHINNDVKCQHDDCKSINTNNKSIMKVNQLNKNSKIFKITKDYNSMESLKSNQEKPFKSLINELNTTSKKSKSFFKKFNILKKAVLSVQDDSLRTEALKALEDCGVKVKNSIPVIDHNLTQIVNESETQTEVNLLKCGKFIQIIDNKEDIFKVKQAQKLTKNPINILSSNNLIINSDQDKNEFKNKLDNILEKVFPNNKNVISIKEAFTRNKTIYTKAIIKQLCLDFEKSRNYNNDGLLGIHKAVLDDNLRGVQKHIILLKALNKSIDIYSQDNQTSLELAIKYGANLQIIKILLEAGALPVSHKLIHDSAVIIASKTSSVNLLLLLKHVDQSHSFLLNSTNSEGLAALHYCAQFGNLEGVVELIKHGADINLQDKRSGRTPLFYAIESKISDVSQEVYNQVAHKLLENGAISNIPIYSKHNVLSLIDDVKSHDLKIALNKAIN